MQTRNWTATTLLLLVLAALIAGCRSVEFPEIPGLPAELREIPDVLEGWELPEVGPIALPDLGALPDASPTANDIVYSGPTLRALTAGEALPGTDVVFVGVEDDAAIFTIDGMRSPKRVADSVEYSGAWPGLAGSQYDARLRVLWIGDERVRLAGVQQLLVPAIAPTDGAPPSGGVEVRFPFVDGVEVGGDTIHGTPLGYLGRYERGAQFTGLPMGDYPYRQVGDSLEWEGLLREGVGVRYELRVLRYGREGVRVAGVVRVRLP